MIWGWVQLGDWQANDLKSIMVEEGTGNGVGRGVEDRQMISRV